MVDARGVMGPIWRHLLFLQACNGDRGRCVILGKSSFLSNAYVFYGVSPTQT
jgi:hypothetical protein